MNWKIECLHGPVGFMCEDCKQSSYGLAITAAMELGLPVLQGTLNQSGYGNVIRLKAYEKHGEGIRYLIDNEMGAEFWIVNNSTLVRGKLEKSVAALIAKSRQQRDDPQGAYIEELTEKLAQVTKDRVREERMLLANIKNQLVPFDRKIFDLEQRLAAAKADLAKVAS